MPPLAIDVLLIREDLTTADGLRDGSADAEDAPDDPGGDDLDAEASLFVAFLSLDFRATC